MPLPLQIARLHVIPVYHGQPPDSGAGKCRRLKGSQRPAADDDGMRRQQTLLSCRLNAGKENLARIAFLLAGSH
jgi:hypothetical protein